MCGGDNEMCQWVAKTTDNKQLPGREAVMVSVTLVYLNNSVFVQLS